MSTTGDAPMAAKPVRYSLCFPQAVDRWSRGRDFAILDLETDRYRVRKAFTSTQDILDSAKEHNLFPLDMFGTKILTEDGFHVGLARTIQELLRKVQDYDKYN